MRQPFTGVILAGGESKRFNGRNKAVMQVCGRRIIDRLMDVYASIFDQIILVSNDPAAYVNLDALIVSDHFDVRSSLNGLHAGLFAAAHEHAFFCACDTPFVKGALIEHILAAVDAKADLVVPQTKAGYEPMFAVYRKTCLPAMEWQLARELLKIQGLFRKVRVKTVPEAEMRAVDPDLISFFNINTPDDLQLTEQLCRVDGREGALS